MDAELGILVELSHHLGDPTRNYVVLCEGNVSVRADAGSFWINASGIELCTTVRESFVRVDCERALSILDEGEKSEEEVRELLTNAMIDPLPTTDLPRLLTPSIETITHALCYRSAEVNFVAHTHPPVLRDVNYPSYGETFAIEEELQERLGTELIPLVIPPSDPGLPLARLIQKHLNLYFDRQTGRPGIILLQDHGLIAAGTTAEEVGQLTALVVAAARGQATTGRTMDGGASC